MSVKMDAKAMELDHAKKMLEKLKAKETRQKRHVWMGRNLMVSHTTMEGLKELVEGAGYEWNEGTLGE